MAGGRRRTDAPGGLWGGTPDELSDRLGGGAEAPSRVPRSRLPLPPVPASPGGPRTSAAPFRAVPSPELPGGPFGDGRVPGPAAQIDQGVRMSGKGVTPVLPRPARTWHDDEPALVSTGPGLTASGARASGPAPRLPRPATPAGMPSPAYGDWTKPSHPSEPLDIDMSADFSADPSGQMGLRMPVAPATTAIPERPRGGRQRRVADDERFDSAEFDQADSAEFDAPMSDEYPARGASSGPGTGPTHSRAAMRAQRQAADMARRKAARKSGEPVGLEEEDGPVRRPRRVLLGLVAMAVVALGVLGVYTVVSPGTEEAASGSTASQSNASTAPSTAVLPPLETGDLQVEVPQEEAAPATPVLAPVTVLNATEINGLAARVSEAITAAGWETSGVGTYLAEDVAATTVFYTEGDETQRQAAESLKAQFPQLQTTAVRSFEVPADVAAPGIVVVLAADWQ